MIRQLLKWKKIEMMFDYKSNVTPVYIIQSFQPKEL